MLICTSICANYLPKAMALAESVKAVNPDHHVLVCLTEREIPEPAANFACFDTVIRSQDLGFANFEAFIFKHSIVEASTAVKGQLFRYLFEAFPDQDGYVYLDPDILLYTEMTEIQELLRSEDIILAPHLLRPGNMQMEISSLKHGVFNLGFLALRGSEEARRFVAWWATRLEDHCRDDIPGGIFTDQKWINLAPCFFNVHILKHEGYDFATWSLLTTPMTRREGILYAGNDPLRFVHFSGYDNGSLRWAMEQWLKDDPDSPFFALFDDYDARLQRLEQSRLGQLPWSYAQYESGEVISKQARRAFRDALQQSLPNPFASSNAQILDLAGVTPRTEPPADWEQVTRSVPYRLVKRLEKNRPVMFIYGLTKPLFEKLAR
jgi:hypothetical protein